MKKYLFILGSVAILTACSNNNLSDSIHQNGHHHGQIYENEQLNLISNTGEQELTFPELLVPTEVNGNHVTYELTAMEGKMSFIKGVETKTYGYNGNYLGPVIRLVKGQEVTIKLTNDLSEPTTFHWHGLEIPGEVDGGPHDEIQPGESKTITFTVDQDAATLWYHPHPMGNTSKQVYKGLAGLLYINDEKSEALLLPKQYGINDFPIIIQDRAFIDGKIQYENVANTLATLGDTIMINGVVNPKMSVAGGQVRLRILNGSNARNYKLHFNNDMPFQLIATDGGFVNEVKTMNTLNLGAGERAEIVVDLSAFANQQVVLMDYDTNLLPIDVTSGHETIAIDAKLNDIAIDEKLELIEPTKHIKLEIRDNKYLINGQTFDMDRIDLKQKQGVTEIWEIENVVTEDGAWEHPFHIHGTQFTVISVDGEAPDESLQGYKDTVTLQPGQKMRIAVSFPHTGLYMFHCHILEHEDAGMMGLIEVY